MAVEMAIRRMTDDGPHPLVSSPLDSEQRLEDMLAEDPAMIDTDLPDHRRDDPGARRAGRRRRATPTATRSVGHKRGVVEAECRVGGSGGDRDDRSCEVAGNAARREGLLREGTLHPAADLLQAARHAHNRDRRVSVRTQRGDEVAAAIARQRSCCESSRAIRCSQAPNGSRSQLASDRLVKVVGAASQFLQSCSGQVFEPSGLHPQRLADAELHLSLADDAGQVRDGARAAGQAKVGMLSALPGIGGQERSAH